MTTYKRVDGDYVITTINSGDTVTLDTTDANFTGNVNVTGSGIVNGDLTVTGNLTAAGNIAGDKITNGSTAIEIPITNGNATISVGGQANVAVFTTSGANITANVTASGNVIGGNLIALNAVIAGSGNITGNLTASNLNATLFTGTFSGDGGLLSNITATSNVAVTRIANVTSVFQVQEANGVFLMDVNGSSNVVVFGDTYANYAVDVNTTGNVNANYFLGNGSLLSGIITSVSNINNGTSEMSVLSSGGNIQGNIAGNTVLLLSTAGANITGTLGVAGNITGNYILGNGSQLSGIITTVASMSNGTSNVNIATANGNVTTSVGGTANVVIVTTTGANITGTLNATGNANVGNLGATNAVLAGALSGATTINASDTVTGGNLSTSGQIVSTRAGNLSDGGGQLYLNGATNNRIDYGAVGTGAPTFTTRSAGTKINLYPQENASAVDYAIGIDAATLWTSVPQNDVSMKFKWYGGTTEVANLTGTGEFAVSGNITSGNLSVNTGTITGGNIVNSNANGVGNIGSSTVYFNTVFAKATSAQYADLAEIYLADKDYAPGTVLRFGGDYEVTECDTYHDHRVAGVVSTNPAHLMNAGHQGAFPVKLALVGRVPCRVRAPVTAGDILVSAGQGWAQVNNQAQAGRIIGKSLENSNQDATIEIVVGKH